MLVQALGVNVDLSFIMAVMGVLSDLPTGKTKVLRGRLSMYVDVVVCVAVTVVIAVVVLLLLCCCCCCCNSLCLAYFQLDLIQQDITYTDRPLKETKVSQVF